jgi:IS30 family transposase
LVLEQNIINRPKGHHLTEIERGKIASFHSIGYSNRQIAKAIGVSPQTINNEINRGTVEQIKKVNGKVQHLNCYFPDTAHQKYVKNRKLCHRPSKFDQVTAFLGFFVSQFIDNGWSPDTAVGRAKNEELFLVDEMVCTTTLYKYIDEQRLEIRNIDLVEKSTRPTKQHTSKKHKRLLGRSIEKRPKSVDSRESFGDFEIDTIVGKRNGHESVVLTLIERKTRFEIMRLIDGRDADSVDYAMKEIIKNYGDLINSITADNGPEFSNLSSDMAGVADVYFTHPYTSCERGTNEVHNRMIRRDLPKGLSLDTVSPKVIRDIEFKLNNMPRKLLNYKTPQELFASSCGA